MSKRARERIVEEDYDGTPSVGAQEIIRCKDCIQFDAGTGVCAYHSPNGYDFTPEPYGFCSWAKRRES